MSGGRILPPTYLFIGLILMGLLHFLLSGPRLIFGMWRLVGVAIALIGAALTVWADALFKKLGTEVKPFRKSSLVVAEGPFRFSRHPMYLGFMGIVLGAAVAAGTLLPLVLVGAMFWLFSVSFVIPEERHMEEQFGEEYRQYKANVRKWL
ncbi:MAG: isoprenylcysteine carboxylmethyltransferase family protein [Candidatus Eisenbacteria bacterium]|uniref:Isoprenylcysteine carboxylmethyltransferase family protein n=1 Tax=Eiseniibacteriota bacterium TaxID=2212470 RepID=A0A948RTU3_UNCEI|nr:isoprenylcysteine carboxylmethyltransferase family protein [Candidatus Eisenbacteria bacterium]MBU1947654.1 isoprenylcysteine carboxylmethyltransferase family protein [Candidatus Eisenbacteria bacterium]MBU2689342.1 isoprenylcysteine carboxylmethyltransferase family protein [Candidatus Eisenbacteria bacterium]